MLQLFNEAQEELLGRGRWHGTVVTAEFCTDGGRVAWPRNVANVELLTICGQTVLGKNQWYRFMSPASQPSPCAGCGGRGATHGCSSCGGLIWTDDGAQCTFKKLHHDRYIKLYPRSKTDVGKKVLLQGYDFNGIWVRRQYNGIFVDGEYVTLASPFAISTVKYSALTSVQKDSTDMNVLAYAWESTTNTEDLLADWQPDELTPSYRVSNIPHLGRVDSNGQWRTGSVNALVKLEHIPVAVDTDWLIIQNEIAIKAGMRARMLYEMDRDTEGDKEMTRAIIALQHELKTHQGERFEAIIDLGVEDMRSDLNHFR